MLAAVDHHFVAVIDCSIFASDVFIRITVNQFIVIGSIDGEGRNAVFGTLEFEDVALIFDNKIIERIAPFDIFYRERTRSDFDHNVIAVERNA